MSDKAGKLFEVAEGQQGYFTAGQAVACGARVPARNVAIQSSSAHVHPHE